ncbi:MAG: hypothetical protein RSF93_02165 [Mucinivorans sp.]
MKKLVGGAFAYFLFSVFALMSCQKAEPIIDRVPDKTVQTRIEVSGEVDLGEGIPMVAGTQSDQKTAGKASPNDLYGIQVYGAPQSDKAPVYVPYAYGLFDDVTQLKLELLQSQFYRVCITMIKDGKTLIKSAVNKFYDPFLVSAAPTLVGNTFNYTSRAYFAGLSLGKIRTAMNELFDIPAVDRYAGEIDAFAPADGKNIAIELKRVVFGVRLLAPDLKEGTIELEITGAPVMTIAVGETQKEQIFSLKGDSKSNTWIDPMYEEPLQCKATWKKANGTTFELGPAGGQTLTVKRNCMYPIKVTTKLPVSSLGVTIEAETPMTEQPETNF